MTGYIKEMLKDFNLPIYKVYREDKPIYNGRFYKCGQPQGASYITRPAIF